MLEKFRTDMIVVGGGPIGLLTAIEAKENNPDLGITVLERYDEYQRKHPLVIDPQSFDGIAASSYLKPTIDTFKKAKTIRTTTIEEKLEGYAHWLGIQILKNEQVTDPTSLKNRFKDVRVIVEADGARSTVRKKVFEDELEEERDLNYICEIKYDVWEKTEQLGSCCGGLWGMKRGGVLIQEHIGREQETKVPVSIRMFISKSEFDQMQGATYRTPYNLESESLPAGIKEKAERWLSIRQQNLGEKRVSGSEKITTTRLGTYKSKTLIKRDSTNDITYVLVGDAAFGVPYFRSLNNGIISSIRLGKAIGKYFEHLSSNPLQRRVDLFTQYAKDTERLARWEIIAARVKGFAVYFIDWIIKAGHFFGFYHLFTWQVEKDHMIFTRRKLST